MSKSQRTLASFFGLKVRRVESDLGSNSTIGVDAVSEKFISKECQSNSGEQISLSDASEKAEDTGSNTDSDTYSIVNNSVTALSTESSAEESDKNMDSQVSQPSYILGKRPHHAESVSLSSPSCDGETESTDICVQWSVVTVVLINLTNHE